MTTDEGRRPPARARRPHRRLFTLAGALALLAPAAGLGQPLWPDQQRMIDDERASVRMTFVMDPGMGKTITPEQFIDDAYAPLYLAQGFDWNFLTWAPEVSYDPGPDEYWSACDRSGYFHTAPVPGGPMICREDRLVRPAPRGPPGSGPGTARTPIGAGRRTFIGGRRSARA